MALSDKAFLMLLLVHEHTYRDPDGMIQRSWMPGERWAGQKITCVDELYVVGGAGNVSILKRLVREGLIQQHGAFRYSFASTPAAAPYIEQRAEWIALRRARNRQLARTTEALPADEEDHDAQDHVAEGGLSYDPSVPRPRV